MTRFTSWMLLVLVPAFLWAGLTFQKTFGGLDADVAYGVAELPDGNYLIVGYTQSFNGVGLDGYMVKMSPHGTAIWEKTYDTGIYELFHGCAATSDGGAMIVGYQKLQENDPKDLLLVKINAQGAVQWSKTYGGSDNDSGWDIAPTPDGNFVISGTTASFGHGGKDVWVLKVDANGDTLWTATFGASGDDEGRACAVDASGHIYVSAKSYLLFSPDMYMIQVNPDGSTGWLKSISSSGWTEGYGVCVAGNEPVFAGYGYWGSGYSHDFFMVHLNAAGDTVCTFHGGGGDDDYAFSIYPTSDGGFIMAGKTFSMGGWVKGMLIKVKNGNAIWMEAYGGDDEDILWDVIETSDHFYLAVGSTESSGAGNSDVFVVKTDTAGQFSGIGAGNVPLPRKYALKQNYPNPFNPTTYITFTLPTAQTARIDIYSALGQKIASLGNRFYAAGTHRVMWDGCDFRGRPLPSGVYFYRLVANGQVKATQKMVLMR